MRKLVLGLLVALLAVTVVLSGCNGGQTGEKSLIKISDLARVMDSYERLMERYMNLTEQNQSIVGTDLKYVITTLDSIDSRMADISARIARIETTLGIDQSKSTPNPKADPQP